MLLEVNAVSGVPFHTWKPNDAGKSLATNCRLCGAGKVCYTCQMMACFTTKYDATMDKIICITNVGRYFRVGLN